MNMFKQVWNFINGNIHSNVLAERQLEESRVQLLEHEKTAEYHSGMVTVLRTRISRLERRRRELEQTSEKPVLASVQ